MKKTKSNIIKGEFFKLTTQWDKPEFNPNFKSKNKVYSLVHWDGEKFVEIIL